MSKEHAISHHHEATSDAKTFGFWLYLMTDLIIFGVLFAAFVVLRHSTFGGPSGHELFQMPFALAETLILLTSTLTCALAMVFVHRQEKKPALLFFALTWLLGAAFLWLEISEFSAFIKEGAAPSRSAFLSAFFTLVGTHGLHIFSGLIWMAVSMVRIVIRPLTEPSVTRIFLMALFWHFLDFVWIFIFTVVYGMGVLYA